VSAAVVTLVGLGIASYLLKSAGPLLLGGRSLPPVVERTAALLPGPLLAALVLTSAVVDGNSFRFDERIGGLVAAAVALRFRMNFVVVVLVAAGTTALLRTL
jgi:uncharacterized membrane protein